MLWQLPKVFPELRQKHLHLWRASLIRDEPELTLLKSFLNQAERERAAKFVVKDAANNFVVARGLLRQLLANYLQVLPQSLVFERNQYGKLYLGSSGLQFNLSHTRDLALFVFARDNPVGVDVEFMRQDYEFADIVAKFFSPTECRALFSLPKSEQVQAFFNCWTCKEAFIKANGVGMFRALNDFAVEISSNKGGKIRLENFNDKLESNGWALELVDPGVSYSGAFATNFFDYCVDFYQI